MAKVLELQRECIQYTELISFRIDWFNLLAFQGTLKSLFQHKLKATIIWDTAFFMVKISYLYMSATLDYLILISLFCVFRLSHFFKGCALLLPSCFKSKMFYGTLSFPVIHRWLSKTAVVTSQFLHFLVLHSFLMDSLHVYSLCGDPLLNIYLTNIYGTPQVIESETPIINTYYWKCFYYKCGKGYKHPHKVSSLYPDVKIAEIIYCAKPVLRTQNLSFYYIYHIDYICVALGIPWDMLKLL